MSTEKSGKPNYFQVFELFFHFGPILLKNMKNILLGDSQAWRHELITSDATAKAFLERELKKRGIKATLIWEIDPAPDDTSFYISAELRGADCPAFQASGRIFDNALIIDTFSVSPIMSDIPADRYIHKGRGISLIGLKALIGLAYEHSKGLKTIDLMDVSEDGPRYWAALSAIPEQGMDRLFDVLSHLVKGLDDPRYSELRGTERDAQFMEAFAIAEKYPKAAFKKLAQIKRQKEPSGGDYIDYLCQQAFDAVCKTGNKIMVINLEEGDSNHILRTKLGAIPVYAVPSSTSAPSVDAPLFMDDPEKLVRDAVPARIIRARHATVDV